MVDHYDRMLAAIVLVLLAGAAVAVHPSIALYQGIAGGSLVATVLLYDVLYRNPPRVPTRRPTACLAVVGIGWTSTIVLLL